jgi:GTP-binding protein
MSKPVVAIVGRPNVGKSMLFNKLVGRRISIVEDTPGVTRDRVMADCEWRGRVFSLVDTGGIEPRADQEMLRFMRDQARAAIDMADAVIMVCDVKTGLTALDSEVGSMLQKAGRGGRALPIIVAVNKCDRTGATEPGVYEFYNLGLGDPFPVSALHGIGTGDLLDACFEYFPPDDGEAPDPEIISVAIIGKPNVGKSSLTNRILGHERSIVSDVPGTTRDATDTYLENGHGRFTIIDTAGMRKKARVHENIEHYSVLRAVMAVERADVCLILIDARDGVTEQDTKVAGLAHDSGKACIVVVNKWDLVDKDTHTMDNMSERIRADLSYMTYAPIEFISAKTGQRVDRLFDLIIRAASNNAMRVTTGMLNNVLADATARVQPPSDKGRRLKIYYMTQTGVKPPHFVAFVNDIKLFHFSYKRYLENQLRQTFGFDGSPIIISGRQTSRAETGMGDKI